MPAAVAAEFKGQEQKWKHNETVTRASLHAFSPVAAKPLTWVWNQLQLHTHAATPMDAHTLTYLQLANTNMGTHMSSHACINEVRHK